MVTEANNGDLLVDAATQQLIQSVLAENHQAAVSTLKAFNEQYEELHKLIQQLDWTPVTEARLVNSLVPVQLVNLNVKWFSHMNLSACVPHGD